MDMTPNFRRVTRDLVEIGKEQMLIRTEIDVIQGVGGASTRRAWFAAAEAARSAMRMARNFKSVARKLQELDQLER